MSIIIRFKPNSKSILYKCDQFEGLLELLKDKMVI